MLVASLIVLAVAAVIGTVAALVVTRRLASTAGPSRRVSGLFYAGTVFVVVVIGLAIPFLLMNENAADAERNTPIDVRLTEAQSAGRQLFIANCSTCHTLAASNSVGTTGPNLDKLRPQAALVENAILLGRARGNGNMPVGLLLGEDAKHVADYVAAVAGR